MLTLSFFLLCVALVLLFRWTEAIKKARTPGGFKALYLMVVEKVTLLGTVFTWDPKWASSVVSAYNNGMANNVLNLLKLCNMLDYFSIVEALERLNICTVTKLIVEAQSPEQKLKISEKKKQREEKNAAQKAALQSLIESKALEKGRTRNAKELAKLALL